VSAVDERVWGQPCAGVAALERELARMRRGRTAQAREQVATVARAAVVNIVVVARREIHAQRASHTVEQLARRHPSRTVVVLGDPHPDPRAAPEVSLYARLPSLDEFDQDHFEQVLVRAHGAAEDRLASVVTPLLVPDLPLFLWWTETPPIGARHFEELVSQAHRLVVDSADFARPEETIPAVASVCFVGAQHCALTDLNWARLTAWRELLTQFFDVPAWRELLPRVDGVRVSFAVDADGREIHPSQALLLIGWLAARLGWRRVDHLAPSEAGGLLFAMERADGQRVRIRIRPRFEIGMTEGYVTGIRMEAPGDAGRTEFRIHRDGASRHASATVTRDGAVVSERILPLPRTDVTELLGEELSILASDRVYEEALAVLVTLA